jgi:hypothetical protein
VNEYLALTFIVAGLISAWYIGVLWWPWAPCRKCGGGGRNRGSSRERWGACARCGGSGKRRRFGARN